MMSSPEQQATMDARMLELNADEFISWAEHCVLSLRTFGYAYARLSPGDMTSYQISIVQPIRPFAWQTWEHNSRKLGEAAPYPLNKEFFVATQFGPLYGWDGQEGVVWQYAHEKWTKGRGGTDEWTARIIARFLNTVAVAFKPPAEATG